MSDTTTSPLPTQDLVSLTAGIVGAYVAHTAVPPAELPDLIASVHGALASLGQPSEPETPVLVPSVPIKRTVTPDAIISLEDGKPYKSLKRHLRTHGLTPERYRAKWGLPLDYPMVAANYAAQRSELAKNSGLGRKGAAGRSGGRSQAKAR
ncbi:MucR family transcriptional regulator [Methylobacterium nodulans]|uniref:Transcriptional regulator, MucR family n=1 Tax=Methylobacterium nodulans (strain LMG 21967 / CNCM I-2342 / ORS 2060) TaxID=460265 RepID=B8IXG3_METNO|nr:MucR family transcriptional regulator [Methylobacterium nodulans]ACL63204.1 transcriptional regulator, MucR family [Methylobacterium nodulans ORS 2060]